MGAKASWRLGPSPGCFSQSGRQGAGHNDCHGRGAGVPRPCGAKRSHFKFNIRGSRVLFLAVCTYSGRPKRGKPQVQPARTCSRGPDERMPARMGTNEQEEADKSGTHRRGKMLTMTVAKRGQVCMCLCEGRCYAGREQLGHTSVARGRASVPDRARAPGRGPARGPAPQGLLKPSAHAGH